LEKITCYHISVIISSVHVATYSWFWSDRSHISFVNNLTAERWCKSYSYQQFKSGMYNLAIA